MTTKEHELVCDEKRAARKDKLWVDERWPCATKGFPVDWVESGRVHESGMCCVGDRYIQ